MIIDPAQSLPAYKASLRQAALADRDRLEIDDRLIWDEAIAQRALELFQQLFSDRTLGAHPEDGATSIVSAYWPMRSEADPRPILEGLHERGVPLCLPAIIEKRMIFRRWAPYEPIVPGGFGTLVPQPERPEVAPVILLVPLAAFDRRGYRIGYGKGHYDAKLTELGRVVTIGIAYGAQEIAAVPDEPHDRRLDFVVTERETIRCG